MSMYVGGIVTVVFKEPGSMVIRRKGKFRDLVRLCSDFHFRWWDVFGGIEGICILNMVENRGSRMVGKV